MPALPLVPANLMERLAATGAFPHRCTIKRIQGSALSGDEENFDYADVAEHIALPCFRYPAGASAPGDFETAAGVTDMIQLAGHYPGIQNDDRAVIGSDWFKVLAVQDFGVHTLLAVQAGA